MISNLIRIYDLLETIDNYSKKLELNPENAKYIVDIYKMIKETLPCFYSDKMLSNYYGKLIASLMSCETKLPKTFILESDPKFNYYEEDRIDKNLSDDELMKRIVLKTRKKLTDIYTTNNQNSVIKKLSFTNDCYKSSNIVRKICNDNGIKNYVIEIHPGFSSKENLCNGNGFHYFNIINIRNKYYLIDCTYRQFFKLKGNNLEKIGILNMPGCLPGKFMLMTKERKEISEKILKDGWIELDEKVLKAYLDGFAISYRNGIYYSETNDYSYTTNYSADDYIRFLKREDNQVNHEGKDCLGYQRKLSKNI